MRQVTLHGHTGTAKVLAISPDGQVLAQGFPDGTVKLWNWPRGTLRLLEAHPNGVRSLAFSPDGRTLATGGSDYSAILWNVKDGKMRAWAGPGGLCRSPRHRILSGRRTFRYGRRGGPDPCLGNRHRHGASLFRVPFSTYCLTFAPDGKTLAAGTTGGAAQFWEVASRKCVSPRRCLPLTCRLWPLAATARLSP